MGKKLMIFLLWMGVAAGTASAMHAAEPQITYIPKKSEVNAHLDTEIARLAEQHNTPGIVAVWVQDGETVYRRNHGYGSLRTRSPIHPETSLMRIGSIAKPFTGLAALSLVEEGRLDLDADVNDWFDPPLFPDAFGRPVTLRHLLTHSAGLDDFSIGKSARTREELPPLGQNVRELLPRRVLPPGEVMSYSNYGVLLAGYLVELAAGASFNEVMTDRVFRPLGMTAATFDPDERDLERVVGGYFPMGGELQEVPFDYLKDGPAGQMLATTNDITRFLEFVTAPGPLPEGQQDLRELFLWSSQVQFTHHPRLADGMGFLWMVMEWDGNHVVTHDGGYPGLMTRMMIFPERNAALYVFTNTMNAWFISDVTRVLVDAFLPDSEAPVTAPEPASTAATAETDPHDDGYSLREFAGHFRDTRYSRNSMTKTGALIGMVGEMSLWVTDDGYLGMPDHTGAVRRLVRVDTLLFASIDDDYHLAFREENGRITHVFTSGRTALERIRFHERASIQRNFLMTALLIFIGIILFYMIRLPVRVLCQKSAHLDAVSTLTLTVSVFFVLQMLLLIFGGLSIPMYEVLMGFAYGVPDIFYVANLLPWIAVVLLVALVVVLVRSDRSASGWIAPVLYVLLSAVYLSSLHYWKLCGWHF
jgi:CubicO group peptidase (beta-lactamase class C family)